MFERFTRSARAVLSDAHQDAGHAGAPQVGEEHILTALLRAPSAGPMLERLGLNRQGSADTLAEIRAARCRGDLSELDVEALAGLGIDVDAVVERVEAELGGGALDSTGHGGHARRRRRSRRLAPSAERTLHTALRQAVARGDSELREEHLLLGLLARRGVVADVLGRRGVTTAAVLDALDHRRSAGPASAPGH